MRRIEKGDRLCFSRFLQGPSPCLHKLESERISRARLVRGVVFVVVS